MTERDKLIKECGTRYAFEWFTRSQDKLHLTLAKKYTDEKCKKIAALAGTNAVITALLILIMLKRPK